MSTLFACVFVTPACAAPEATGELAVRIYGEAFIEQGIGPGVFVDGWTVSFSRYLVAVDAITAADAEDPERYLFDLTAPSNGAGQLMSALAVPAGEQRLGFRIGPGPAATAGNASPSDRAMMQQAGLALLVEGTATKDADTIAFAWGFDTETTYDDCEVVESVPEDGEATATITIHADHIFYDDLDSTMPNTAFDLIAASDADMDGTVTAQELRMREIATEARYQVGSHDVDELWGFMSFLSRTVGHIDGEGECKN